MFAMKAPSQEMYLIPVAFDHMLFQLSHRTRGKPVRFESEQNLESAYLASLYEQIKTLGGPVCLDMRYISSAVDRGFQPFAEKGLPLFFCGLSASSENLRKRLNQDMGELITYEHPDVLCVKQPVIEEIANRRKFIEEVDAIYQVKTCELLKSVTYPKDEDPVLLESSGVRVSSYVALKDLLLRMEDALFILYRMAERIHSKYPFPQDRASKILICCSKTGAAYTSLLSMLLNMRAVYCVSVGPKFALDTARLRNEIEAGQDYIYVFDFLCMGAEAKILHALVSCLGGNLEYGIGAANYLNIREPELQDSFLSKLETLTDIRSAVPDYQVYPVIAAQEETKHGD